MNKALEREWYLEIHGIKTGPYTPEQVQGLLEEGEILVTSSVIHSSQVGLPADQIEWFTAGEFVNGFREYLISENASAPPIATKSVDETPLPIEYSVEKPPESLAPAHEPPASVEQTPSPAPAQAPSQAIDDLFETLLLARDRKNQNKLTPPTPEEWGTLSRKQLSISPTLAFVSALGVAFLLVIWGMFAIFKHKPSGDTGKPSVTSIEEKKSVPPPPSAPPVPMPPRAVAPPPAPPARHTPPPPSHENSHAEIPPPPPEPQNPSQDSPTNDVPPPQHGDEPTSHFEGPDGTAPPPPNPENSPVSETPPPEMAPQQYQ